jgi:hypothetical protein
MDNLSSVQARGREVGTIRLCIFFARLLVGSLYTWESLKIRLDVSRAQRSDAYFRRLANSVVSSHGFEPPLVSCYGLQAI